MRPPRPSKPRTDFPPTAGRFVSCTCLYTYPNTIRICHTACDVNCRSPGLALKYIRHQRARCSLENAVDGGDSPPAALPSLGDCLEFLTHRRSIMYNTECRTLHRTENGGTIDWITMAVVSLLAHGSLREPCLLFLLCSGRSC